MAAQPPDDIGGHCPAAMVGIRASRARQPPAQPMTPTANIISMVRRPLEDGGAQVADRVLAAAVRIVYA